MAMDGDPVASTETTAPSDASVDAAKAARKAARKATRLAAKAETDLAKAVEAAARAERKAAKKAERKRQAAEAKALKAAKAMTAKAARAERKAKRLADRATQEAADAAAHAGTAGAPGAEAAAEPEAERDLEAQPDAPGERDAPVSGADAPFEEPAGPEASFEEPGAPTRGPDASFEETGSPPASIEEPAALARESDAGFEEPGARPHLDAPEEREAETLAPTAPVEPEPHVPWPAVDRPSPAGAPGLGTIQGTADEAPRIGAASAGAPDPQGVPSPGSVVGASVDIGANSAHLLVAAVSGHRLEPLLDESAFLGLGDRVARDGFIGAAARAELVSTLTGYADAARRLGAAAITLIGTEPLRRAADAALLVHEVLAAADVPLHVVDHDEEAMLVLLGATGGRAVTSELLVVDIGGGSCEFIVVGPGRPVRATGLRLGGARLTQEHVRSDPPTLAEIDAMRVATRTAIIGAPEAHPSEIIAVGGTASNLLKLLPATAVDRLLTRRRITVALAMLSVERSAEAAERHLLRPQRARVLPAGALIVDAILEHYGAERLRVSDEGVREGTVLAAAVGGPGWRDRLPSLVAGWGQPEVSAPV